MGELRHKGNNMNEHWKLDKTGQIAGVWGLDLSKMGRASDDWDRIDQVITEWAKIHPLEMAEHIRLVHELNSMQDNDLGSGKEGLRYGAEVPTGLGIQLQLVLPDLFTNKALLHKFMKRYKGFTVATRV
jgi:hypothetical protein